MPITVAANTPEREIAGKICGAAKNKMINLGDKPLTLGQLKALFLKGIEKIGGRVRKINFVFGWVTLNIYIDRFQMAEKYVTYLLWNYV